MRCLLELALVVLSLWTNSEACKASVELTLSNSLLLGVPGLCTDVCRLSLEVRGVLLVSLNASFVLAFNLTLLDVPLFPQQPGVRDRAGG
jgi:hypothetical protein